MRRVPTIVMLVVLGLAGVGCADIIGADFDKAKPEASGGRGGSSGGGSGGSDGGEGGSGGSSGGGSGAGGTSGGTSGGTADECEPCETDDDCQSGLACLTRSCDERKACGGKDTTCETIGGERCPCLDPCDWPNDGVCDEPDLCCEGTDMADCSPGASLCEPCVTSDDCAGGLMCLTRNCDGLSGCAQEGGTCPTIGGQECPSDACNPFGNCEDCVAEATCVWCGASLTCVTGDPFDIATPYACDADWRPYPDSCYDPCFDHTDCGSCVAAGCGWCANNNTCMSGDTFEPDPNVGGCKDWRVDSFTCDFPAPSP